MAEFLKACVKAKLNLVISGGTGSGKTTLLNALASCIPSAERVITIEDAAEMKIGLPHLVGLESRQSNVEGKGEVPIRQLVKNSLRMRPDRIVVGEIRGGEALDMLQAMNTGHQGSLTTVHANAPLEALYRIETMTLMSDVELPLSAIRAQIKQAVSVVVQQERLSSGRRVVTGVSMLLPNFADRESGYELISIFEFVKTSGMHRATGQLPPQPELFADAGVELLEDWFLI
jgi:pilus assembly protein CpaF